MAARKKNGGDKPAQVRKSLMVEADKLERARKLLGADSDSDVLRQALDYVLAHYRPSGKAEEEE
jgi:hypothetical protein